MISANTLCRRRLQTPIARGNACQSASGDASYNKTTTSECGSDDVPVPSSAPRASERASSRGVDVAVT